MMLYVQAEPAQTNRWHFLTGLTVLLGGYAAALLIVRYFLL